MSEILIDKAPPLFGSDEAYLGFPSEAYFTEQAMSFIRDQFPEAEYPALADIDEEDYWVVRNAIHNKRDDYFRLRCRDNAVRYSPDGKTSETYEHYMGSELFSSAFYAAWYAYDQAPAGSDEQELHRQRMVFAGIININDALQRGMAFLDPRLKNDGLVRTKHFMGFLARANALENFVRTPEETAEFTLQHTALQLAVAEVGAQEPTRLAMDLHLMDDSLRDKGERTFYQKGRSQYLNLTNLCREDKVKLVERYQQAALQGVAHNTPEAFFLMQLLHLYSITTASDYYDPETHDLKYRWFVMDPQDVIDGTFPADKKVVQPAVETFDQGSLF